MVDMDSSTISLEDWDYFGRGDDEPRPHQSMPRVVLTLSEGDMEPIVIFDENQRRSDSQLTDIERFEVSADWLDRFESAANSIVATKKDQKRVYKEQLKLWKFHDERQPHLRNVLAFDEATLACLLDAWHERHQSAEKDCIALRDGQLFWIPRRYSLRDSYGSFKFDFVLKQCEAEDLYEKLKEDLENFKNNSDSAEQKKRNPVSRAFSATLSFQDSTKNRKPQYVICIELDGIECTNEKMRRRKSMYPKTPVFATDEVVVVDLNTLSKKEKHLLCDLATLRKKEESESL